MSSTPGLFATLFHVSLQAGFLALLIMAAKAALGSRLSPRWHHGIWLLLVARLLLPAGPASRFSVGNYVRLSWPAAGSVTPEGSQGLADTWQPVATAVVRASSAETVLGSAPRGIAQPDTKSPKVAQRDYSPSLATALLLVWATGMAGLLCMLLGNMVRVARCVGQAETVGDEATLAVFESCRLLMGVRRKVRLLQSDAVGTPALIGVLRPAVIVPAAMETSPPGQKRYVFLHELAHARRGDIVTGYIVALLQAIHWFNPLLWMAFHRMRSDREFACDAEVLARTAPSEKTHYARAILRIAEMGFARPAFAGIAGILETKTQLRRRITMISNFNRRRNNTPLAGFVLAIALAVVGLTEAQPPASESKDRSGEPAVTVTGKVTDKKTGQPLADALVRAAAPAADMRKIRWDTVPQGFPETRTDDQGVYRMTVPLTDGAADVSLDAFHPGHSSLNGAWMGGGDYSKSRLAVQSGTTLTADLALPPAPYVAGMVIDEQGQPVAGARGHAGFSKDKGSYAVGRVRTDAQGRFEFFDFPDREDPAWSTITEGTVWFSREDLMTTSIASIYDVPQAEREALLVVMRKGLTLEGTVVDTSGNPVSDIPIHIQYEEPYERRDTRTDVSGQFSLKGLPAGKARLYARSMKLDQRADEEVEVAATKSALRLQLQPTPKADISKAVTLLGMKLIDVTPELAAKYDLHTTSGVLILDPGKDHARLGIGELVEGNRFFWAGMKPIGNLREWVAEILKSMTGHQARVVYTYSKHVFNGTNTQYLTLTDADVRELEQFLGR